MWASFFLCFEWNTLILIWWVHTKKHFIFHPRRSKKRSCSFIYFQHAWQEDVWACLKAIYHQKWVTPSNSLFFSLKRAYRWEMAMRIVFLLEGFFLTFLFSPFFLFKELSSYFFKIFINVFFRFPDDRIKLVNSHFVSGLK